MTSIPALDQRIAIAKSMAEDLDGLVDRMMAAELSSIPALGTDAALKAEVRASNRANAESMLALLTNPKSAVGGVQVPPEAVDVVRTTVRRGLDLEVIYRAYQRGHTVVWNDFLIHAGRLVDKDQDLVGFLADSSALLFDYIDQAITQLIAAAQREREEILGGALARRVETVRLIVDGAPIEIDQGNERLGYDLRRWHTGLVLWSEPGVESHGRLESVALHIARSVGARPPLTVVAGVSYLWAWVGTAEPPRPEAFRDLADIPGEVRVAVGSTRQGVGGFRATHLEAIDVHDLMAGRIGGPHVAVHEEYEVTLLLGREVRLGAEFVQRILGPLAEDTPAAERLRESLRIFLAEGGSAPKAAARLFTHRNTMLQRIDRASRLLGFRPEENRLSVAVALELAHHLGPQVLVQPAS